MKKYDSCLIQSLLLTKRKPQGYPPTQKAPFILSSSASLSMVCMVSRVIIMKGILWDTAVKGARGERRYLLTAESSATPPCVNNKHFKAAWGRP